MLPITVKSSAEEDQYLGTCSCGGMWALALEDVVPLSQGWYDAIVVRCASCRRVERAIFDITPFFEVKSRAWAL
jgi:hypothetical protein